MRTTRVVLAAAHLDSNPENNRLINLKSLCPRCHMLHDRPYHLARRWITYRRRSAVGDLFFGPYEAIVLDVPRFGRRGTTARSLGLGVLAGRFDCCISPSSI